MIKMERAQLAKPAQKSEPTAPVKSAEPPRPDPMMAFMAQVVAAQNQQSELLAQAMTRQAEALDKLATRPTRMEATVRRDKDGRMTRVLIDFKQD
jgi:hypothetical protein